MVKILMMSAKLATPGLLKTKIFKNKDYDVIIIDYEVRIKILSCESNCIVDVIMRPKFGNSSISMKEVIITSIIEGFDLKNHFFEGLSWFKLNNLGLALGKFLKFYNSVVKVLKLKVRTFWGISFLFVEVTKEELV